MAVLCGVIGLTLNADYHLFAVADAKRPWKVRFVHTTRSALNTRQM